MIEPTVLLAVVGTFLLAGAVKGVIGLGLPSISLALLTVTVGLPQAMALLLAPAFATNLWQAVVGGHGITVLRRTWPFLLTATLAVWAGAAALTRLDPAMLSALLGCLLIAYGTLGLADRQLVIAPRHERWAGPLAGTVNGVLTGMTGSFVMPGVPYLQAIGLPRDLLIQAMGMLFSASSAALAAAMGGSGLLTAELGLLSAAALAPAFAGMAVGRRIRHRLPEPVFRRVFFVALLALGAYIVGSALGRLR